MKEANKEYQKIMANLQSKIDNCKSGLLKSFKNRQNYHGLNILNPLKDISPSKIFCRISPIKTPKNVRNHVNSLTPEPFITSPDSAFKFPSASNPATSHKQFKIRVQSTTISRKSQFGLMSKGKVPELPIEMTLKSLQKK